MNLIVASSDFGGRRVARFGLRPVVNGNGTVTRLSGGIMAPEVADAMREASQHTFDMWELHAAACRVIARSTGAPAGIVLDESALFVGPRGRRMTAQGVWQRLRTRSLRAGVAVRMTQGR